MHIYWHKNWKINKRSYFSRFVVFQTIKVTHEKNNVVFNIFVIYQQILEVLKSNFSELVLLVHIYWDKISKINKMSNFFDNFWHQKSNLKKSLPWGTGNWLIWTHIRIPYEILVLKMGVCTQVVPLIDFQALRT